jgi:hypothetical protein
MFPFMWFCREAWTFFNRVPRVFDPWSRTFPAASPASLLSSPASARCCADRSPPPANFCRSRLASSALSSPKDAELGDILMKGYILRRMLIISEEVSNVLVLGSLNSANTLRLREFLGRNGYPYKFIDLDTDERSQSILDHFQVKVDEVPVVICNARSVLRNPSIRELADCLGLNVNIDESQVRDLIVVGAGPSGLAAAVFHRCDEEVLRRAQFRVRRKADQLGFQVIPLQNG